LDRLPRRNDFRRGGERDRAVDRRCRDPFGAYGGGGAPRPRELALPRRAAGLGSGAFLALASVGYRGAMLQIPGHAPWLAAAYGLVWAPVVQTVRLGGALLARDRDGLMKGL